MIYSAMCDGSFYHTLHFTVLTSLRKSVSPSDAHEHARTHAKSKNIASSSQSSATAVVLRDFLPAYDTLSALKEKYAEDAFGRSYTELTLQQTFENLGVTNYNVEAGEAVNTFRMKVLESEMSKDYPKDTVIRQVSAGLELDGNVIRAASCVASLGAEEEKKEADAAGSTDGGSEDAAGETE